MANPIPELAILSVEDPSKLRIHFSFPDVPPPDVLQAVNAAVHGLARVGAQGGFATQSAGTLQSSMDVLETRSGGTDAWAELNVRFIDLRALSVLRNLCVRISANVHPIETITIVGNGIGSQKAIRLPLPDWGMEDQAYPATLDPLSFSVEREDPLDFHKTRRAVLEFGRPVEAGILEALQERVRDWIALGEGGGFSPPVKSPEVAAVWEESVAPFDAYSLEVAMRLFEASESYWNVLLNLVEKFSLSVEPLAKVTIE